MKLVVIDLGTREMIGLLRRLRKSFVDIMTSPEVVAGVARSREQIDRFLAQLRDGFPSASLAIGDFIDMVERENRTPRSLHAPATVEGPARPRPPIAFLHAARDDQARRHRARLLVRRRL